jgi:hypothetical protein
MFGSLLGNGSSQSSRTLAAGSPDASHSWVDGELGGVFTATKVLASSSAGSVALANPVPKVSSEPRTTTRVR